MPRKVITIGNKAATPIESDNIQKTIFLAKTGTAGTRHDYIFTNGSINYFNVRIKQSFEYILVDNIGSNDVRIAFNRLGMNLASSQDGAKTLRSLDSLYIQDSIKNLSIYFIGNSTVELILISS